MDEIKRPPLPFGYLPLKGANRPARECLLISYLLFTVYLLFGYFIICLAD